MALERELSINYVGCKYNNYNVDNSCILALSINYVGCKWGSPPGNIFYTILLSINYVGCKYDRRIFNKKIFF